LRPWSEANDARLHVRLSSSASDRPPVHIDDRASRGDRSPRPGSPPPERTISRRPSAFRPYGRHTGTLVSSSRRRASPSLRPPWQSRRDHVSQTATSQEYGSRHANVSSAPRVRLRRRYLPAVTELRREPQASRPGRLTGTQASSLPRVFYTSSGCRFGTAVPGRGCRLGLFIGGAAGSRPRALNRAASEARLGSKPRRRDADSQSERRTRVRSRH
jgi:hypothetical protein